MIKTVGGTIRPSGVGSVIAHRRVMVSLTPSGFSLHDAHGPPIDETISNTPYGSLANPLGTDSTNRFDLRARSYPRSHNARSVGLSHSTESRAL